MPSPLFPSGHAFPSGCACPGRMAFLRRHCNRQRWPDPRCACLLPSDLVVRATLAASSGFVSATSTLDATASGQRAPPRHRGQPPRRRGQLPRRLGHLACRLKANRGGEPAPSA
ncbi:hypothetical protein GUJ93_ZPchr0014g47581 [Zizania palustris]|uniref:Uncharacterized protein n=1 Tax=Zizania palustris TaxID=103762 RepID=A0A8J5SUJ1_ZIZPA|nr:hypothetical protein GUJ93_ZPchr0014g47581 [Zizania palustris]